MSQTWGEFRGNQSDDGPPLIGVICVDAHAGRDLASTPLGASLNSQTFTRWKLVAHGATDGQGPGRFDTASFAAAVAGAETPYFYAASCDATLDPTLLEKLFWFLSTHPNYAFVNTHERRMGADGQASVHTRAFFDRACVVESDCLGLHVLVRTTDYHAVGGLDASRPLAEAAWDFWLRAAACDRWGSTIAEVLIERPSNESLGDLSGPSRARLEPQMRERFPRLFQGHQPAIVPRLTYPFEPTLLEPPARWRTPAAFDDRESVFPRRMLLLIPWLRMGGADKFNLDLCRSLAARGCRLTIATTAPSRDEWHPLFYELTRDIFRPHLMLHWAEYPILLRTLIQTRRPDVVFISNSELSYHLLPYFRSFSPEPLYIDYVHMEEENWKSGGHARHSAGLNDQLDLSLVTSEHLRRWMTAHGADASRVDVCPIGVDEDAWRPDPITRAEVRRELGLIEDHTVILHAGRICEQKQPKVLARTIQRLSESGRDFTVLVAGDGEDLPWLERFIETHGLSRHVRFLGSTSPERVRRLMAASDLFFLPSAWEGVALVLYEAMAMGVVFVGSKVGGQGEVGVEGAAVLLEPARDADVQDQARAYAHELGALIDAPQRRREIAERGRERIEKHFTHTRMMDLFQAAIEKARRLQKSEPRQTLSPGLGQEMAARAIEYIRLEWQASQHWREAEYWKAAASKQAPVEAGRTDVRAGRGALRRVMRALRGRTD